MNFKKIILATITILIAPYAMYPMLKKTSVTKPIGSSIGNKLLTSGRTSIPLLTTNKFSTSKDLLTKDLITMPEWNNSLIPMTSDIYQARLKRNLLNPDIARTIGLEAEISQKIVDLNQLNVRDQKWIDNQLKDLNKLYDRLIMSKLNSNETLMNIYRIQTDSESKLQILNDIKEKLISNGLKTELIDNYIEETKIIIAQAKRMDHKFIFDEPGNITKSPELQKDFSFITINSRSPNDFLENLTSFLNSPKYQKIKNENKEQKARAKAQSKDPEYRYEKFYDQSNYEPYALLNHQFKETRKDILMLGLGGLATEEYMRRKQSAEQKSSQKAAERNDMRDFIRER